MNTPRSSANRITLALVILAGGWLLFAVFTEPAAKAEPARTFTSSAQCRECHPEPFAEWEASQHAMSWTNPAVRALSNDFANQDCIDCHAPRPVFVVGIGERILPRAVRRVEGVDCIACHQLPGDPLTGEGDGGMAGTLTDPRAACRPRGTIELTRPEFCAGCHNQHRTVDQWRESEWPEKGENCISCHMPSRDGDPKKGRSHAFLGGNSLDMLQRAVTLSATPEGDGWRITVANVGAGHAFPTDERSRAADIFWRLLPMDGNPGEWVHLDRIRDPYRTEVDIPSTLVHAGEERSVHLSRPETGASVEVVLFYKRSPFYSDPDQPDPEGEATAVHRLVLLP